MKQSATLEIPEIGEGWLPEIRERLLEVIEVGAKRVSKNKRAVAVFDFDHTVIFGDIGASFAQFVTEHMLLRYDLDAFWELIPESSGRSELRLWTSEMLDSGEDFKKSSYYQRIVERFFSMYREILERDGVEKAYSWALQLYVGISELDMATFTQQVIAQEMSVPVSLGNYSIDFHENLKQKRGFRPYLEMCQVMRALESVGFELWIVSATNYWTVSTFAAQFGIDNYRVIGNRLEVDGGLLTDKIVPPVLYGKGKKEAIKSYIDERPLVVFGDSMNDYDMLKYAKEYAVVIDYAEPNILKAAQKNKWGIQPFSKLHLVERLDEIPREARLFDPYEAPPLDEEELKCIHLEEKQQP